MIDLKQLREDPQRFRIGARDKGIDVDIDRLLELDAHIRRLETEIQTRRAEQNRLGKEVGPQLGKLKSSLKSAADDQRATIEVEIENLQQRPALLKQEIQQLENEVSALHPQLEELLLAIPLPADPDVPRGIGADDNVEIKQWQPNWFDPAKPFAENKGFGPKTHIEIAERLGLIDFERAVKISGSRHYILRGAAMRLHQAVLRLAFDYIVNEHEFAPMSVPVIVREECMIGTGFFPTGRDTAYHIDERSRGGGHDLYLTGTGEVGLMGIHTDEILDESMLPLKYATVSTCFRREAGAAGKDTAGLYRVHQFDKVEQVVICRADEQESRHWHRTMIEVVEKLLQQLELPYRLLQCCTGDLGAKNADMIDIETWMPGRGDEDDQGRPTGAYGETHSASRLYDFQCRRLKLRYKDSRGQNLFCHSLNNTVIASPRILIPMLELHQNEDGSVTVPTALRPYMGDLERIG